MKFSLHSLSCPDLCWGQVIVTCVLLCFGTACHGVVTDEGHDVSLEGLGDVSDLDDTLGQDGSRPLERTNEGCLTTLRAIQGTVVDESGQGLADVALVACPTLADGVKVCIGPMLTDVSGHWSMEFDEAHQCPVELSIRATDTVNEGPSVSCRINSLDGGHMDLGILTLPSLNSEAILDQAQQIRLGGVTLESTSEEGHALMGKTSFATLSVGQIPRRCRVGTELTRFALWPDGPVSDIKIRQVHVPHLEDGVRVSISLIGGLFTFIEEDVLPEGYFFEIAQAQVSEGKLELDMDLPAFGWFSISAVQ